MKQWVKKLIDQLDYEWGSAGKGSSRKGSANSRSKITDERATILFMIDTYNKHLVDLDTHPVRRVREALDGFAKDLVEASPERVEDVLFKFRQFFASYRVAEYAYIRKNFEEFKGIIWNFVEQLSEESRREQNEDKEVRQCLTVLKEAVETDSIDLLRSRSREFIDFYIEHQAKRDQRRAKRMKGIKKNLDLVKKQLSDADRSMRLDHLTGAYNRKSFDEQMKEQIQNYALTKAPCTMLLMDIDFFKRVNDSHGHDVGDFVLKECVRMLQEVFSKDDDFVARVGGEEFAVILPEHGVEEALLRVEACMNKIRKEVFIMPNFELRFTVSMGVAPLLEGESPDSWYKRADSALYHSKQTGRDRFTIAADGPQATRVA